MHDYIAVSIRGITALICQVTIFAESACLLCMYWDSERLRELIRYPIEGSAEEIGSPVYFVAQADLESEEVMVEVTKELRNKTFDYAPIRPYRSREYYDVEAEEVRPVDDKQYVGYKEPMLYCINILTEYPFVLVVHPDKKSWKIVTRSDLNTRIAKEYLYSYYAETARAISRLIESEYDIEEIQEVYETERSRGMALKYWEEAVDENVNLHPVEFMSMADLKEVVVSNEGLREQLDFPSKTKCRKAFVLVEDFRNKIMHGYRTVIMNQDDVNELAASLESASEMTIHAGGDGPGLNIPP